VGAGLVLVACAAALAAGCGGDGRGGERTAPPAEPSATSTTTAAADDASTPTSAAATPTTTAGPTTTAAPAAPSALAPVLAGAPAAAATEPRALAAQIEQAERAIRDPSSSPELVRAAGQVQQLAYRRLADTPDWETEVLARTPDDLDDVVGRHLAARREFRALHTRLGETLPAWRIVDPLPADELLTIYGEAEARFGVPWTVLAAVNLVETGLGRIVGLSTAGAQGPMQFMPATWAAYGMGGDVWNTRDAVLGAANYLAANGADDGAAGISAALYRYNHSDHYVRGVEHYAALLAADSRAFLGVHAWQVVFSTLRGDVVLPVGYEQHQPLALSDWLAGGGGAPTAG
jgi:membrane-bound lytic murein transglycosylase B